MGLCKDCRHWHPEQYHEDGVGECALADYRYVWGLGEGRKLPRMEKTGDGDLYTHHDFGCVEFEEKDA